VWVAPSGADLVCLMPAFDGCVLLADLWCNTLAATGH
jgi:hypothetical protein